MEANLNAPPRWLVAFLAICTLVAAASIAFLLGEKPIPAPDFSAFAAGEIRKLQFFEYFRPIVTAQNNAIAAERAKLEVLRGRPNDLSWFETRWLNQIALKYAIVSEDIPVERLLDSLLDRVDVIPVSLVLAQAAKESGWGTSRFAREGHNYFGQRCFRVGCGVVPNARTERQKFEVATFDSPQHAVASYFANLNTHTEYAALRAYRSEQRAAGEQATGTALAGHLTRYSERRQAYVDDIQSLIQFNNLENTP